MTAADSINGDGSGGTIIDRSLRDQLRSLQSQLMAVKGELQEIDKRIADDYLVKTRQLQVLNTNIKRIGLIPARSIRSTVGTNLSADLSPHPRTLYELWDNCTSGIGGWKHAREFTAVERGKVKYKYYRCGR